MITVKKLINAEGNKKLGNHRVEVLSYSKGVKHFYYYATAICKVNENKRQFEIDDSYGTVSTKRACNAYRSELNSLGYTEIES